MTAEATVRVVLDDSTIALQPPSPPFVALGVGAFENYFLFEHDCVNYQKQLFRSRGYLPLLAADPERGWTLVQEHPLTIHPSILCQGCKSHGFITDGEWKAV